MDDSESKGISCSLLFVLTSQILTKDGVRTVDPTPDQRNLSMEFNKALDSESDFQRSPSPDAGQKASVEYPSEGSVFQIRCDEGQQTCTNTILVYI